MVEYVSHTHAVVGSSPALPTKFQINRLIYLTNQISHMLPMVKGQVVQPQMWELLKELFGGFDRAPLWPLVIQHLENSLKAEATWSNPYVD